MSVPEKIEAMRRDVEELWEASQMITDAGRSIPVGTRARREMEDLAGRLYEDGDLLMADVFRMLDEAGIPSEELFDWEQPMGGS